MVFKYTMYLHIMSVSNVPFPLPQAPQQHYTKWFNHVIKTPQNLLNYTILWVGTQLPCRFKSDTVTDVIGPPHVFICKKNNDFNYNNIDKGVYINKLPKKFYTSCFPGIQYNSVPKNNRIQIQLTNKTVVNLPFIPPSFLVQKKLKTSRAKRKRSAVSNLTNEDTERGSASSAVERIDFNECCPSWHILGNSQVKNNSVKQSIFLLIRSLIDFADKNSDFNLIDPFQNIQKEEDLKSEEYVQKIKLITAFVYHFCRSELGCGSSGRMPISSLQSWTECLNNTKKQ